MKAVLFDYNGTLLDDLLVAYGSVAEIFRRYGILSPTLEQYREEIITDYMKFYYDHGFSPNFSGSGAKGDADALNAIRKEFYENHASEASFRPDAVKTIIGLKEAGIKVAIVSADIESVLVERLNREGMVDLFERKNIWGGVHKDKTPILLEACRRLGVDSKEAVYVDDTVDGTSAAVKAGMVAVGFGNGYNSRGRLLEITPYIIDRLSELLGEF